MDQTEQQSESPEPAPAHHGHHRSARERQRRGPMWGCLRGIGCGIGGLFLIVLLILGGLYWYTGTTNFADLIKARVESTLEARLGREVTIGSVEIIRTKPQRAILRDVRIANAPGGVNRYFATVREVEIAGGLESFWGRKIKVGRVDIRDPRLYFEVFPEGSPLVHNFPKWNSGPPRKRQIVAVDIGTLFVTGGGFSFLDRRHDIEAVASNISSTVRITRAEDLYAGLMESPQLRVRLQDYEPFDVTMRGGFRYTPGVLALESIALRGRGIEAFVAGKLAPLTEGAYDLEVSSRVALERIAEIFRIEKTLQGEIALDTNLRGKQGDFTLAGGWITPRILADVYELTDARGKLKVTGERTEIDVERAHYGGGTIGAHYVLPTYKEPYPMSVDLRYDRISIEKLFNDWGVKDTGLRGAATGQLAYEWKKDQVLAGAGEGNATLTKNSVAFSNAKYPIPVGGSTDFALDNGVVTFKRGQLVTDSSTIGFTGKLKIEGVVTDLNVDIESRDFSELDRAAYNFAHSADKKDFELLGLAGSGRIRGTVSGPIDKPMVAAEVSGSAIAYNNVVLGDGELAIRYDGPDSVLTFERATFRQDGGTLALTGTLTFPESGPSPRFDIAVDANGYSVERAIKAMDLDFKVAGIGTGRLIVTGSGESGRVTFVNMLIRQREAELKLAGDVAWLPGEGNVRFDLDIDARDFPVGDIAAFLDFGTLPVKGALTGTLHLEGSKKELEGEGSVTVRRGEVYGEPIDVASANIRFTKGTLRATDINITAPAGQITGDAEIDLNAERFSYSIKSSSIDFSKLKIAASLASILGGTITLESTGAGTFEQPELVVQATLNEATLQGLTLPPGTEPPTLYIAIRNGRLTVRGAIADIVTVEGDGNLAPDGSLDGLVKIVVSDLARALAISPRTASIGATGNFQLDLRLGGKISPIEALRVEGTVPVLNVAIAGNEFSAPEPLRFAVREGKLFIEQFQLQHPESLFTVTGNVELVGDQRIDISATGSVQAALLQLFVADLRAEGHVDLVVRAGGTLKAPRMTGTANLHEAEFRFAGFPQAISDVNGLLTFRGDRIDIDQLRATVGGGTVFAGGFITIEGLMPKRARITLQGTNVTIRYFEGLTLQSNFNVLLSGDMERAQLSGDVNVTRALYFKDFDFRTSLLNVILSRRGVSPVVGASWQDRVDLRLRLTAPETLAVRNNIADVTGSAELDVAGTLANPVVLGEVTLDEGGTVRFQNIDYNVVRGTINFQNPFRIDPFFDIVVEGRVSGGISEIESGPIDVTVNLTGTLDRFTPSITSDPPASDITLFSLLGFGNFGTGRSTGPSPGASTIGQSLLLQNVVGLLGSRLLPFADSFTFDPGLLDTAGDPGPKVTFERRVSNNVRFILLYNLEDHRHREVLEWQATRDWSIQLTRDEIDNEYRVEGRFRRRYEARWTWGRRGRGDDLLDGDRPVSGSLATSTTITAEGVTPAATNAPAAQPQPATPRTRTVDATATSVIGQPITAITLHADATYDTASLQTFLQLKPGDPLTIRGVQSSIKSLFSAGDFRDIRADAVPSSGGVALTLSLFLQYRIGEVQFDGLPREERTRAAREVSLRTGEVLSLDAVDDSATAVQTMLQREGYLEATVDPETEFDRARSKAKVTLHVTAGPQAKIREVLFEGDLAPYNSLQLIDRMRRKPGRAFSLNEARTDAERIQNYLLREDHRKAEVRFLGHTYDAATKSVSLRYRAVVGPIVRVAVTGVPRSAVRRLLPFRRNQEYSEDAVDQAAEEIVKSYQQRGHYNASVDTESGLENGVWTTTFIVNPGPRYRLTDVTFSGNVKLSDKELDGVVETSPRGGIKRILARLLRRPTSPTRDQLGADRDAIEAHYRLQGFSEATVDTPKVATRADGTMTVDFPINEGPQTLVTEVKLEGIEQINPEKLPRLQLRPGQPLNPQHEREDMITLQTYYANRGNAEVQITPRIEQTPDKTGAVVTYVIAEGPKIEVDDVVVRGNTYTSSEVVLRKSELDSGDPFSYTSILQAQQNLYRLGIFQRVDVQPEQVGTSVADRNVVISVEEGRNLTLSGSLGLSSAISTQGVANEISPRVAVSAAHRNLFGTGRFLGLEVVAAKDQNEAFITFREPFIGRYDVPVQVTVFQSDDARRGRHILQRGTFIEASKVALLRTRWSARYEYKISKCIIENRENPDQDVCSLIEAGVPVPGLDRSLLDIQISSVTGTFFWDKRDDSIDPHRGFFTSASTEYAFPLFEADAQFMKEFLQGAWYLPVTQRSVFAISGRLGLIQSLANDDSGNPLPVPLSERFTSGGDTSHRAFPLDLLGQLCTSEEEATGCRPTLIDIPGRGIAPLGGEGLLLLNAEYRFPISTSLGGAFFVDAGNVYPDDSIKLDELRFGVGAGVRYISPLGPLRFDLGYNPRPREWEDRFEWFVTLGYAF